ncbi:MAG: PHP domain-containing protein [Candidatus Sabulitectum sp.]|nr:PHP domain-containing protein [Candidatus Sabulitectum sp.]
MKHIDMHVHTFSSPDADISATELCRMALEAGVKTIGFVAHVDLHPSDYCYNGFSESDYLRELDTAESERVRVLRGLELGEPHRYREEAELLFTRNRYDFITGALHWIEDRLILDEKPFLGKNTLGVVEQYYKETLKIVQTCPINILAHMGIFRRGMARAGLAVDFDETALFNSLIRDILETMIQRGIALEVNTAGLRRPEGTTYPTASVIRMYAELGGSRITLGSDTHRRENAFFGLSSGCSLIKSCGFMDYGTFVNYKYVTAPLLRS